MLIIDPAHPDMNIIRASLLREFEIIWAAHRAVGLQDGFMQLFLDESQDVWRAQNGGQAYWFSEAQNAQAVEWVMEHYNNGALPNSPALLNPTVHEQQGDSYIPKGSGIFWATGYALGVAELEDEQQKRLDDQGIRTSRVTRGENHNAGIKALGFSSAPLAPTGDGLTVLGCAETYNLSDIESPAYGAYYTLSAIQYLCTHGLFCHPGIDALFPEEDATLDTASLVQKHQTDVQKTLNASQCFDAYDRHHMLLEEFGTDPAKIDINNRYYNMCARDIELFYKTGPMRESIDDTFEFVVPGYIPRGAVTLLAAPGGTGKSSIAHHLCVLASMDAKPGDPDPLWLGQPVNMDYCRDGICVYFSGEDGPAIINARSVLFDPEGKSQRLQFHRSEFADKDMSFADYLTELRKMPHVPIVVIDPARKYLTGDEEDAEVVSEFFEAIEEFAISKQCAMVVVHHLKKGANPQSTRELLDELRGSQVFIDRPRVVMGMFRDGPHTVVGLAKNNIPPNLGMVTEERVFARNPKNLTLMWLPGDEGVRSEEISEAELQRLEAAEMQRLAEENKSGA